MKVHNYYLATFLHWLYMRLPLEEWFDVRLSSGRDCVLMEIRSKEIGLPEDFLEKE